MPTKTVNVKVDLPPDLSEEVREDVQRRAEESVVLWLWEKAVLSTRQAAAELDLNYHEFLDLLAERGIPVARGDLDLAALDRAREKLGARGAE